MSDYLGRLAERYSNLAAAIRPQPVSIYEPPSPGLQVLPEPIEPEVQVEYPTSALMPPAEPIAAGDAATFADEPEPPLATLPRLSGAPRRSEEPTPSERPAAAAGKVAILAEPLPHQAVQTKPRSRASAMAEPPSIESTPGTVTAQATSAQLTASSPAREIRGIRDRGRRLAPVNEPPAAEKPNVTPAPGRTRIVRREATSTQQATPQLPIRAEPVRPALRAPSSPARASSESTLPHYERSEVTLMTRLATAPESVGRAHRPLASEHRATSQEHNRPEPLGPAIVEISIGDIEVRAAPVPPPAPAPRRDRVGRPPMSLEDYLRRRSGAPRR
jgi:hypothetical protein